jgi:cytochrome c556
MRHLLLILLLAGVVVGLGGAEPGKAPDIKQIMQRANKPTGIYFNLKKDLEDEEPSWTEMRTEAHDLAQLAAALGKQTPPKGDKASWMKLSRAYADNAQGLYQAVAKKDKKAARAALTRMGGDTCKTCHKAHRLK